MSDGSWTSPSPAPPAPQAAAPAPAPAAPRRRSALTVVAVVLLVLSVVANAVLVLAVIGLTAMVGGSLTGGAVDDNYLERVVEKGPAAHKIAVIRVEGLIYDPLVGSVQRQLRRAALDDRVKAVIIRINSPGGYLTASDMLYHAVKSFREQTGKPVIASMDAVAASGGYYTACGADTIVAQRTTVTGSIGVIAQYYFLNGLLQDKLGIHMVTLKMGEQKDWPNMFSDGMTPEQTAYLMGSLLEPGYNQFVDVVAEARKTDRAGILKLATGRIFMAADAEANGLIDEIGYFERAVEIARERAGLRAARVVEYVQPFGFLDLLGASARPQALIDLRPETLTALVSPSPRVMALWTGQ